MATTNDRVRLTTYTDIPNQFPALYQEDGEIFVEFVQAYYKYLEQQEDRFRDAYNIRDIDTTYDKFLIHFKKKYLSELPLDTSIDTRFIVKHIQDLYRRKGSEESLRLIFRMFFDEEIEVTYPSTNILKVSNSTYTHSSYIELRPVNSFRDLAIQRGDRLFGDTSKANAFVDEIVFHNLSGTVIPIIYLSNGYGKFVSDDDIQVDGVRVDEQGNSVRVLLTPGKIIRGSVSSVDVVDANRQPGNQVGETVSIRSSENGSGAKAVITSITETVTGVIKFAVEDGGYGYSSNNSLNDIFKSNQVVVTTVNGTFDTYDVISAANVQVTDLTGNSAPYSGTTVSGTAQVVSYDEDQNVLFLNAANSSVSFTGLPQGAKVTLTNETSNTTFDVVGITEFNDSASFEIGSLNNSEVITFFTDIVGDYLGVVLNAADYGMSGANTETITTTLADAFSSTTLTIGSIAALNVLDEGVDYRNDVACVITQSDISKFQKQDVIMTFNVIDFVLQSGDVITQIIDVENFDTSILEPYTVRGKFLKREGSQFFFRQLSFHGFDNDSTVSIKGNDYNILSLSEDPLSKDMGTNAITSGLAAFEIGQIQTVDVIDTGFYYRDGESVELLNSADEVVATATIQSRGDGFTTGKWTTTSSFLNDVTKVIHDNHYYQDYSYDISSIINPDRYTNLTRDLVQVAGTKQFNSHLINSVNNIKVSADVSYGIYDANNNLITSVVDIE